MAEFLIMFKLVVVRYENKAGIHLHIDNIKRDNGPVITMSIGPKTNVYSMVPIDPTKQSINIYFPNGSIITMDGESRYLWAHGIPYGFDYGTNMYRYSFVLLSHKFSEENKSCFYSDIYNSKICGFF